LFTAFIFWIISFGGLMLASETALHADRVLVFKKEHTQLLEKQRVVTSYKIVLGRSLGGPKTRQADHKTPEGIFTLDFRNSHSQAYKAVHISYPSPGDHAAARRKHIAAGGDVSFTACRMVIDGWGRPIG
jgi:murein L,D-transpeptidase YafK